MLSCEEFRESIIRYIDNELEKAAAEEFKKHMKSCKTCKEEYIFQKNIIENCRDMAESDMPEELENRLHEKIMQRLNDEKKRENKKLFNINREMIGALSSIAAGIIIFLTVGGTFQDIWDITIDTKRDALSGTAKTEDMAIQNKSIENDGSIQKEESVEPEGAGESFEQAQDSSDSYIAPEVSAQRRVLNTDESMKKSPAPENGVNNTIGTDAADIFIAADADKKVSDDTAPEEPGGTRLPALSLFAATEENTAGENVHIVIKTNDIAASEIEIRNIIAKFEDAGTGAESQMTTMMGFNEDLGGAKEISAAIPWDEYDAFISEISQKYPNYTKTGPEEDTLRMKSAEKKVNIIITFEN